MTRASSCLLMIALGASGCSGGDEPAGSPPSSGIEAGTAEAAPDALDDASSLLKPLSPPADPGPGGFLLTASGERLALGGYPFIQGVSAAADPAFVDGWEVKFERVIVTLDHVTLSESPDVSPTDQAQTGKLVARLDGPFAVDLHRGGPLQGKGGEGEQSIAIGVIKNQTDNGGGPFDPQLRYALGFDSVAATDKAWNVNLDAEGLADYQEAIEQGWSSLFVGTATYRGTEPSEPQSVFARLPRTVRFRFGFAIPTTYLNCQNPDNDPAEPYPNEEHLRGVRVKPNASTVVQLTMHTDHLFWEKNAHEQPLHFDPVACPFIGETATPTATLQDMALLDFTGFRCKGEPLPPRSLVSDYTPVQGSILYFNANGVSPLDNYRDYLAYSISAQGHLNSDGLCAVKRQYPSPP